MTQIQKKKLADVLCDFGKYIATAVPLGYFIADKPGVGYLVIATTISGVLFITYGLILTKYAEEYSVKNGKSHKRKVKILKNAVFQIEEQP